MRLVLIHGRSQQGKNPLTLTEDWLTSLRIGMQKSQLIWPPEYEIKFPFYGDKLDELEKALAAPLIDDVVLRGAHPDSVENEFRGELLYEMATGAGITDAEIQAHYEGSPKEKGPLNWEWVHAILQALDRTSLGENVIDRFTRDVYVYMTNKAVRKAIDAIVAAEIVDGPCVVVGHSLGTIVGYNVLRNASAAVAAKAYITVGSPLGIKAIKKRLDTPLAMPTCTSSWFNAMDDRDVVALNPLDSNHFPITPSIENKTNIDNHTKNRHGIAGYLDDIDVASKIYHALVE